MLLVHLGGFPNHARVSGKRAYLEVHHLHPLMQLLCL
jgi:hypothetical protein